MDQLLFDLNREQREAVTHEHGPLLLLAGPGSGKTRVITRRIAYRVAKGVPPDRILAITFTNSAATELRERIAHLIPDGPTVPAGTFHWAGNALLRRYADRLGRRRDFRVLSEREAAGQLAQVSGLPALDRRVLRDAIGAVKNGVTIEQAGRRYGLRSEDIRAARERYDGQLAAENAVDMDDLLVLPVQLLEEHPDVRERCRQAYEEILVDEYQDTNPVQQRLLALVAPSTGAVTVVGDDDQAVYGWRWADPAGMMRFPDLFPGTRTIVLGETYRSTKHILRAASALIAHNTERAPKALRTGNPAGERPVCAVVDDEIAEGELIAHEIEALVGAGEPDSTVGIIYRVNAQARAIEDALVRRGIPYVVRSGSRFYDLPEIRAAEGYLRLVLNPADVDALMNVISGVPGLGPARSHVVQEVASQGGTEDLSERLRGRLPHAVWKAVRGRLDQLTALHEQRTGPLQPLVDTAITAVRRNLESAGDPRLETRTENLEELRSLLTEMGPRATLRGLVDRLALGGERGGEAGRVSLLTVHAAKGREFDTVFLPGLEEGLLPHRRSLDDDRAIEEERRLLYVGMTRARRRLYLSYAHTRVLGGHAWTEGVSRFVREIGSRNLDTRVFARSRPRPRLQTVEAGERVVHPRWGPGAVAFVEGKGREAMVTIDFDRVGRRRVQLCHTPLEREGLRVLTG